MSDLPISTASSKDPVKIRMGTAGMSALPPLTVMDSFNDVVKRCGDKPALYQKLINAERPADKTPFTVWTWKEYRNKVDTFAKALLSLGFQPFDVINIIGFNSRDWFVANFGAIAAGGIAAGIYTTNLPDACKYISEHSEAKVVVVEGLAQLKKYIAIAEDLPYLKAIVMYGPDHLPADIASTCSVPCYTFDDFLALGIKIYDEELATRIEALKPEHTCALIYTSGTTGPPKAVMITHDNITWTVRAMLSATPRGYLDENDCMISYLPLSHIAAQMLDMHLALATGTQTYFAQPDALKGSLGATLKEVRPTCFFGVPRVWEKIYDKLQEVAKASTGLKKILSTWAKKNALLHWESREFASTSSNPSLHYAIAKKLLHKAHIALGLDRAHALYVSAAPIEVKILRYFASLDLPIMELFGQSECTGPHSVNKLTAFKIGTVGRPLPGTETKIDKETGELCYRGRHIFAGYMKMKEMTDATIDSEGWLHSGDIAKIDNDNDPDLPLPSGFISITGRIKELIITAGGENVPPVLIEDRFKLQMPALSNCMVVGDKRKFLSILLCLQVEMDDEGNASDVLTGVAKSTSKEIGSTATTTVEVGQCEKWKTYFDKGMAAANKHATSSAQKVNKWALLTTDFTVAGGELTPTLKLKRSVAASKYATTIDEIYA